MADDREWCLAINNLGARTLESDESVGVQWAGNVRRIAGGPADRPQLQPPQAASRNVLADPRFLLGHLLLKRSWCATWLEGGQSGRLSMQLRGCWQDRGEKKAWLSCSRSCRWTVVHGGRSDWDDIQAPLHSMSHLRGFLP